MRQRRVLAVLRLMPPNPRRALAQSCVSPSKSQVPFPGAIPWWASGFLHAINAVFVGGMRRPKRAHRLGSTAMLRRASPAHAQPMTQSSAKRLSKPCPCMRGRTSCSTHSSSTWGRKILARRGGKDPALHDACLGRRQDAFFHHACPHPLPHEAQYPPIIDPLSQYLA